MFCLSKGLGAPIGSMVVGTKEMITKLRVNRKRMGGNMRKPGIIAQSGIIALDNYEVTIKKANESAQKLSAQLVELGWIQLI
jgi:threonine aldolase